jgi:hypothetical protein
MRNPTVGGRHPSMQDRDSELSDSRFLERRFHRVEWNGTELAITKIHLRGP